MSLKNLNVQSKKKKQRFFLDLFCQIIKRQRFRRFFENLELISHIPFHDSIILGQFRQFCFEFFLFFFLFFILENWSLQKLNHFFWQRIMVHTLWKSGSLNFVTNPHRKTKKNVNHVFSKVWTMIFFFFEVFFLTRHLEIYFFA